MSIAVTGSEGQLGSELCRRLGAEAIPLDLPAFDLLDETGMRDALRRLRPEAVINTAAYTQVDAAESDSERCFAINADAVRSLAEICRELEIKLVQLSTDYVFAGNTMRGRPFREDDPPFPQGVYAESKRQAETFAALCPRHVVIRTCGLYGQPGERTPRGNFVDTMLRLSETRAVLDVVADQQCTPSYVPHVAAAALFLTQSPAAVGLFHVVNGGETNWCEFARAIFALAGRTTVVRPTTTAAWNAPAPRPTYSVLDTAKYQTLGGPSLPHWREALAEYLTLTRRPPPQAERIDSPNRDLS